VESWNKPVLSSNMRAPTIPPAHADNPHHCAAFSLSHYTVSLQSASVLFTRAQGIMLFFQVYRDMHAKKWPISPINQPTPPTFGKTQRMGFFFKNNLIFGSKFRNSRQKNPTVEKPRVLNRGPERSTDLIQHTSKRWQQHG